MYHPKSKRSMVLSIDPDPFRTGRMSTLEWGSKKLDLVLLNEPYTKRKG